MLTIGLPDRAVICLDWFESVVDVAVAQDRLRWGAFDFLELSVALIWCGKQVLCTYSPARFTVPELDKKILILFWRNCETFFKVSLKIALVIKAES